MSLKEMTTAKQNCYTDVIQRPLLSMAVLQVVMVLPFVLVHIHPPIWLWFGMIFLVFDGTLLGLRWLHRKSIRNGRDMSIAVKWLLILSPLYLPAFGLLVAHILTVNYNG